MSIINGTYYKSDISLIPAQTKAIAAEISTGSSWQDANEDVILQKLMGYPLWKLYKADLEAVTAGEPTATRFIELVDGAEFTFEFNGNSITTKWPGLRDKTLLISLIANYVYYQYRNQTENFNSGAGQKHSTTENSIDVDITPKLIYAWNEMINMYGQTPSYYVNKELFLNNGNYVHFNSEPSAYNFLLANLTTYPEWIFEPLEKQNIFGI